MSTVKQLYHLEEIDTSLDESKSLLQEIEAELHDRNAIVQLEAELDEHKQKLAGEEQKRRMAENEVQDTEGKLSETKTQLYSGKVTNPKELINLERGMRQLESILKDKDEVALELMVVVDEAAKSVEEKGIQLEEMKRSFEQRCGELETQRDEVNKQRTALEAERLQVMADIPPQTVELYRMLRVSGRKAVVTVEREVCMGCRITLPRNVLMNLREEELVHCPNCNRILYLP